MTVNRRETWCSIGGVWLAPLMLVVLCGAASTGLHAQDVDDDTVFELDGNALDPANPTGDDWETVNPSGGRKRRCFRFRKRQRPRRHFSYGRLQRHELDQQMET